MIEFDLPIGWTASPLLHDHNEDEATVIYAPGKNNRIGYHITVSFIDRKSYMGATAMPV